jgi:hypothetical protein
MKKKEKRAAELELHKELAFQNEEKKRAAELHANKELSNQGRTSDSTGGT